MPDVTPGQEGPLTLADAAARLSEQMTDDLDVPAPSQSSPPSKPEPQKRESTPAQEPEKPEEEPEETPEEETPEEQPEEEPEPESEPEEEPEPAADQEPLHTVKIRGKEEKVTLKEALAGYQRGKDYALKTQELAAERKATAQKVQAAEQKEAQYVEGLKAIESFLQESAPPQVDWDKLRKENPSLYAVKYAEHQQHQEKLSAVQAERQRVMQEQAKAAAEKLDGYVREQYQKLQERFPDWADAEKRQAHMQKIADYARTSVGYTKEEVSGILDSRAIEILDKARMWDEHVAKTKGAKETVIKQMRKAPVMKPGSTVTPTPKKSPTVVEKAARRFKQTGKLNDAAQLLALQMDD